jgi:hypothetical protein
MSPVLLCLYWRVMGNTLSRARQMMEMRET